MTISNVAMLVGFLLILTGLVDSYLNRDKPVLKVWKTALAPIVIGLTIVFGVITGERVFIKFL